ncbi:MAG: MogA/MoaB family molybdenum cofactor biosynthesis protein [Planctomycetes bacterium]|nr:MogA/MoaB family molybdenum cofactor biosynthesis protein [Planctomycetota bacterium]
MGAREHRNAAGDRPVRCSVVVVSDARTERTDTSGRAAETLLAKGGFALAGRTLVPNDPARIRRSVRSALRESDFVLTIGGTGPGARDVTIETVRPMLAKELPGFGELFRARSVREVGTAAMLTRALLGVTASGRVAACVPGSEGAVRLALRAILLPELRHLVWNARRR